MSAKNCVTHHYACDCREASHAREIENLRRCIRDLVEVAERVDRVYTKGVMRSRPNEYVDAHEALRAAAASARELLNDDSSLVPNAN